MNPSIENGTNPTTIGMVLGLSRWEDGFESGMDGSIPWRVLDAPVSHTGFRPSHVVEWNGGKGKSGGGPHVVDENDMDEQERDGDATLTWMGWIWSMSSVGSKDETCPSRNPWRSMPLDWTR